MKFISVMGLMALFYIIYHLYVKKQEKYLPDYTMEEKNQESNILSFLFIFYDLVHFWLSRFKFIFELTRLTTFIKARL